jgi:predicted DNA binding CopG/RHH family protein
MGAGIRGCWHTLKRQSRSSSPVLFRNPLDAVSHCGIQITFCVGIGFRLRRRENMLHFMPQVAADSSSSPAPDFAGLLAALTSPARKRVPAWNDDQLADDVATLSYEHALRTQARYKAANMGDGAPTQIADSESMRKLTQRDSVFAVQATTRPMTQESRNDAERKSAADSSAAIEQARRRASITIRLSRAECEQLKRRAADAGLSISAYLRSCTFEAEALRAQVKEALAELRRANAPENRGASDKVNSSHFGWLRWLRLQRRSSENVART